MVRAMESGSGVGNGRSGVFRALLGVLRWRRSESALFGRLDALHAAVVTLRIRSLCGTGCGPSTSLAAMPPAARRRIELAPEVFRLVFYETCRSPRGICEALERFCAVEESREGRRGPPTRAGSWSALGDVRVGGAADVNGAQAASSGRSVGAPVSAPTLRRTVVDGYSPFRRHVFSSADMPTTVALGAGEFRAAVSRLSSALGLIESTCGPAMAMLDACLRVIAVARTPRPVGTISISRPILPGMAGLADLHSERWSTEGVADALVHEATHALIYRLAFSAPLCSMRDADQDVRVVSPWTGHRLSVVSFVHAGFVWFGLWHFWSRAEPGNRRAAAFAERARRGFDGEMPLRNLSREGTKLVAPDVLAALRAMTREAGDSRPARARLAGP